MSNLSKIIGTLSIQTIPENALLDAVVQKLQGREVFKDTDINNNERIYHGDVFEAIASELEDSKEFLTACMLYPKQKVIDQFNELAELINADYVLVTIS